MSLKRIAPPALEPVTLSEMKLQCGFGPMDDTDQFREQTLSERLRDAIAGAREHCETETGRAFITQTWQLVLDRFPRASDEYLIHNKLDIDLPIPTFQALSTFTYLDGSSTLQNMLAPGGWGYQIVAGGDTQRARIRPSAQRGWPTTQWETANAVTIQYTCGYGDTPAAVPRAVRNAVKLYAQWLFEGSHGNPPNAVANLLVDAMTII